MREHLHQNFYTQLDVAELLRTPVPSHKQRTQHYAPPLPPVRLGNPFEETHGQIELSRCIVRPCNPTHDPQR
jgi:hypothetical protein